MNVKSQNEKSLAEAEERAKRAERVLEEERREMNDALRGKEGEINELKRENKALQ